MLVVRGCEAIGNRLAHAEVGWQVKATETGAEEESEPALGIVSPNLPTRAKNGKIGAMQRLVQRSFCC